MPRYFAHISRRGPVKYASVPIAIGVLEATDKFIPIGEATCRTWDENGLAVWTIRIGKENISGRCVIVDKEFKPVDRAMTRSAPPCSAGSPGTRPTR
jgi:hypothetical protein